MSSSRFSLPLYSLALLISGAFVTSVQATPFSLPAVEWQPCYQASGYPFECASVDIPLIHDAAPSEYNPSVSVKLIRLPATDPERRIGSLFFNPGGPGASGTDFLLNNGPYLYSDEVRARYDLIGFDPRGVASSGALVCSPLPLLPRAIRGTEAIVPKTLEEIAARWLRDLFLTNNCDERSLTMMEYMTTADVARDLDLLRQAVGDEQLNFVGYSYGSYLGITYANLFPDNVGAMVIDGVIDPVAWATGRAEEHATIPVSARVGSDSGAMATLGEFFRLCDESDRCAFRGDSARRFAALTEKLKTEPLIVQPPDGQPAELDYDGLIFITTRSLNNPQTWPFFAQFLATMETGADPTVLSRYASILAGSPDAAESFDEAGHLGVMCSDSDNPHSFWAWPLAAWKAESIHGYFGPFFTWSSSACAFWPASGDSRYAGPFNRHTANPILVVNTRFDAATPYGGAVTAANLLPNARLLTVDGWGHPAAAVPSQCLTTAVTDYLVDGIVPAEGAVCEQDIVPFMEPEPLASASRTMVFHGLHYNSPYRGR